MTFRNDLIKFTPTSWKDFTRPDLKNLLSLDQLFYYNLYVGGYIADRMDKNGSVILEPVDPIYNKMKEIAATNLYKWYESGAEFMSLLERGEIHGGYYWSGTLYAKKTGGMKLSIVLPKEGTVAYIDYLCVLKDSQKRDLAEFFINYCLGEEAMTRFIEIQKNSVSNKNAKVPPELKGIVLGSEAEWEKIDLIDWGYILPNWKNLEERWKRRFFQPLNDESEVISISMEPVMAEIELNQVSKKFGKVTAVNSVSLAVEKGEFLALLGPSGCGKTTLLRLVAGYETTTTGDIFIHGERVNPLPPNRRNVGMVFQNYALFPHKRVFDNVAFGLRMRKVPRDEIRKRVQRILELTRCQGLENRYPGELSGGQQQRVALARALVIEPDVLALDEPLGALDKKLREDLQVELKNLHQTLKTTTVFVTHDQEEALGLADRIAVMNQGCIQQSGSPRETYESPQSQFVADFIGTTNFFHGKVVFIEANRMVVDSDDLKLEAPARNGRPGEEVFLTIRPEKIVLTRHETTSRNCFPAQIVNIIYLGSDTHYYLELTKREKNRRF